MVLYRAPLSAEDQMADSTPEQQEEGMKAWMDWAAKCGDKLVDLGTPLGNGLELSPGGGSTESGSGVAGYSILEAESIEEAKALLQGHPHLGWNEACSIELYEAMPLPGM